MLPKRRYVVTLISKHSWRFKDKDGTGGKANSEADRVPAFDVYTATLSA
jgi:hypothetical protein